MVRRKIKNRKAYYTAGHWVLGDGSCKEFAQVKRADESKVVERKTGALFLGLMIYFQFVDLLLQICNLLCLGFKFLFRVKG